MIWIILAIIAAIIWVGIIVKKGKPTSFKDIFLNLFGLVVIVMVVFIGIFGN